MNPTPSEPFALDDIPDFKTPESYEQYAINVERHSPEKATEARRRAVMLRAKQEGAETDVERECLEAVFAYEWTLFRKHGKRQRASYTWRAIREHGIVVAAERAVLRAKETAGFQALAAEGMLHMAFEAVITRHPEHFSSEAVSHAQARVREWESGNQPQA